MRDERIVGGACGRVWAVLAALAIAFGFLLPGASALAATGDTPVLSGAVLRKTHAAAGSFDLPLSLTQVNPTTEPRAGPAHTLVFVFDKPVTSGTATLTEGEANVGTPSFIGNAMSVPLTGVTNKQYVTVAVTNVASADGGVGGSAAVRIGFLLGDASGNRAVTLSDLGQVNAQIAQPVTTANYLKDVNASGTLSLSDKGLTNTQVTQTLPAVPPARPVGVQLPGQSNDLALAAITTVVPAGALPTDVENHVILTRLDVVIEHGATVGQVNAGLASVGGGIVSMTAGETFMTIAVPRQANAAALAGLAATMRLQPGILAAFIGKTADYDLAPPGMAGQPQSLSHLWPTRFPAAWNTHGAAIKRNPSTGAVNECKSNPVTLVFADGFGNLEQLKATDNSYSDYGKQLPGPPRFDGASRLGVDPHGYEVMGAGAGAGLRDTDYEPPTGANPFPECLQLVAYNLDNLTEQERAQHLSLFLPAGKLVINSSLSFNKCINPCGPAEDAIIPNAFERAMTAAYQRKRLRVRAVEWLVTSSAGNNRDKDVAQIYLGAADADHNSRFNLAARADSAFSTITNTDLWQAICPFEPCAPRRDLTATAQQRADLTRWLTDNGELNAPAAENVLIVGSSTRTDQASAFSSAAGDVFVVGEDVQPWSLLATEPLDGTSVAAPQVAGLASYLWLLSPELRQRPVADTIAAIKSSTKTGPVPVVDAYATVLALDGGAAVSPTQTPIRLALLDANGDGDFDNDDILIFRNAFVTGGMQIEPSVRDDSRHDLNGDGFTGGSHKVPFDLDPESTPRFGRALLTSVTAEVLGRETTFDENAVADGDVLCYYANSPLYTGTDLDTRDALLKDVCAAFGDVYVGTITERITTSSDQPSDGTGEAVWTITLTRQPNGLYLPSGSVSDVLDTHAVLPCPSPPPPTDTVHKHHTSTRPIQETAFKLDQRWTVTRWAVFARGDVALTQTGCGGVVNGTLLNQRTDSYINFFLRNLKPEFDVRDRKVHSMTWDEIVVADPVTLPSGVTSQSTYSVQGHLDLVPAP